MGKKKIIKQTNEEVLREREVLENALKRVGSAAGSGKALSRGRIYIQVSYNNTLITATDIAGNVVAQASAGALGFKGPKKATPFAAARVVEAIMEKISKAKTGPKEVEIYVRGVGGGRESAIRAFAAKGLEITLIKDITPIPHNGPRPPKPRRV